MHMDHISEMYLKNSSQMCLKMDHPVLLHISERWGRNEFAIIQDKASLASKIDKPNEAFLNSFYFEFVLCNLLRLITHHSILSLFYAIYLRLITHHSAKMYLIHFLCRNSHYSLTKSKQDSTFNACKL